MVAPISIRTAAELIAAIPALVGFVPTESLIMVALAEGRILFTARHDLADITVGHTAASLAEVIALNNATSVLLVGIGAEPSIEAQDEMVGHLAGYAIDVHRQLHVTTVAHAAEYIDYATGQIGIAGDYRDSAGTVAYAVEEGRAVMASRQDFAQMFATVDPAAPVDPETIDPEWTAQEMLGAVSLNTDPGPETAARFGALIANVNVRDAMLRLGTESAGTAATVMARTAAHLRGDDRARVLTLAMFFYYAAGNGAAAGIAADTVANENLEPTSLMRLLGRSLQSAMHPRVLAELIPTQADASSYLGAPFPI
ncbi:DUF4192 domain-containing protein [Williamsia sp. MIQD14]|uniref:DUF4192 domain-containing protein n=1 Tax=Williamsia sp. MIQD14 TaxID=3425703 RepID=UPI003DA18FF1